MLSFKWQYVDIKYELTPFTQEQSDSYEKAMFEPKAKASKAKKVQPVEIPSTDIPVASFSKEYKSEDDIYAELGITKK